MIDIILFNEKKDCCACCACMNICNKGAIDMKNDEFGFLYPEINKELCIRCGACVNICAYQKGTTTNKPIETYVAVTDNTDVMNSASGGVFASFAISIIDDGGIVYGSSLECKNNKLVPMHIAVEKREDLVKVQGSKYVQSNISYIYSDVKRKLDLGREVLFSGTPCQVDGLRSFLRREYENLLLIDIICHGTPNANFFQDYILTMESKVGKRIVDFKFRDKSKGWGHNARIDYQDGEKQYISGYESSYFSTFLKSYTNRENCYSCKYAGENRAGDITIGDYWGVEYEHQELLSENGGELEQNRGVSCLIVNTNRGMNFLNEYKYGLKLWKSSFEKASKWNDQLRKPSNYSKKREKIMNLYRIKGYVAVEEWFYKERVRNKLLTEIKNLVPKSCKSKIKKIIKK